MENNKSSILAQFFTGAFGGVIFGIAGLIALTNIHFVGPIVPIILLFISVLLGVILGIVIANKTKMTRQARVIPWLGIGFFILPPVLLVGAIDRLTPRIFDPMELYVILLFMIGIMATSIVLSATINGAMNWRRNKAS